MNIKCLFTLVWLLIGTSLFAQTQRDTIFIYDTIRIATTRPAPPPTIFFEEPAATISKNSIIIDEQSKQTSTMKEIITTTLAIAMSLGVFAQEIENSQDIGTTVQQNGISQENRAFSFGARAGLGFGFSEPREFRGFANEMFYPTNEITHLTRARGSETNFNLALYGNFAFNRHFSLQAELSFMMYQGYDMRITFTNPFIFPGLPPLIPPIPRYSINADLSYFSLDIPLLAKVDLLGSDRASFGFFAGPHVSIPLGRAEFWRDYFGEIEDYFSIDNSAVFGLTAGLFCRIPVGPGQIVGDFRFVTDFQSLKAQGITQRFDVLQRRAFVLSLGYQISF
ncbi:MAG: PorT family protein [Bacteroidales bacterium]|nr:PorT family protein [Bacteroidales bacterium]